LAWLSVWSEVQTCIWPSWCNCHSLSLASVKSRLVLPFWYRITRVVPDKGPLNGCVCVFPVHCKVQEIYGVRLIFSYLVGGTSDAAFRCPYCRNLFCLRIKNTISSLLQWTGKNSKQPRKQIGAWNSPMRGRETVDPIDISLCTFRW